MFQGYGVALLFAFPFNLLIFAVLLGICFGTLFLSRLIVRVPRVAIVNHGGSLVQTMLKLGGICTGALALSLLCVFVYSYSNPFFAGIHSEWGYAWAEQYRAMIIYYGGWAIFCCNFPVGLRSKGICLTRGRLRCYASYSPH